MRRHPFLRLWVLALLLLASPVAAQKQPYIGYAYPAGGQQGTTFQIKLGGQGIDDARGVLFTGAGVTGEVAQCYRRLNNQELQLIREQLKELKEGTNGVGDAAGSEASESPEDCRERIEQRLKEHVQTPACAAIATLVFVDVTIAPEAEPGPRELRVVTLRGVSNPLVFDVGQLPERRRPAMLSASVQVLGKEEQALRKRPEEEVEVRLELPCTVNGQVASGEVNRYRFDARKGQRLVFSVRARQLIPFVADAVPGWFQPVLTLYDADGREVAFSDDYRFHPDPVILHEIAEDGEYVLAITDAIYRGREDFVYRISMGELPWVTSVFPPGARAGAAVAVGMSGWNLEEAVLKLPGEDLAPGLGWVVAVRNGLYSNRIPFALDRFPDESEVEPNNESSEAREIALPVVINGRIDPPGDRDRFRFAGKSNTTVVVEVSARQLGSPVDSVVEITDAAGRPLAFNDDHGDAGAGVETHQADSWCMAVLPADGDYEVQVRDRARQGGEAYCYRLRVGPSAPDFELRVVPSSVGVRTNATLNLTVYAVRKDGFDGPIRIGLAEPASGFTAKTATIPPGRTMTRLTLRSPPEPTAVPVTLVVEGEGKVGGETLVRRAIPAEDRMQAFLWRHLVPAQELTALVFDPGYEPPPRRVAPTLASAKTATDGQTATKPKFEKSAVGRRLRELERLYEDGFLMGGFYLEKVAACEVP